MDDSANARISITDSRDENDQMFPKNRNLKKTPMKHFMAPTISATSKVAIPRKKILTERNESSNSSETHQQNTPNLVPKTSQVYLHDSGTFSRKTASETIFYESGDDENKDSSSKPYNPLTNYLSPRPKFLRYNPNRNRGMYNRREIEIENEVEGSDGRSSSVSSSPKSSDEIGNEEIDIVNKNDEYGLEDDEEIEDIENEGCSSWIEVFKFTLVSIVLLLLTWYISCMNPMAPTMHLIRGSTNGYTNGYNRTCDIVDVSSTWEELVKPIDHVLEEGWVVCLKPIEESDEVELKEDVFVLNLEEVENVNDQNFRIQMGVGDQVRGIEISEIAEKPEPCQNDQIPTLTDHDKGVEIAETGDKFEISEIAEKPEPCQNDQIPTLTDHDKGVEIAETGDKFESSDLMDTHVSDNEKRGNAEKPEPCQNNQIPTLTDHDKGVKIAETGDKFEISEIAEKPEPCQNDQIPTLTDHDKGVEIAETGDKFESSDLMDTHVSDNEKRGNAVSLDNEVEVETIDEISAEADEKAEENYMESDDIAEEESSLEFSSTKDSESNLIYGAFVGILVIIASLILAFYSKCKRRTPLEKSQSIKKPVYNTFSTISEDQSLPKLEEPHIKEVESFVNSFTYFPSVEEKARDYPSRAPTVELLGEFIVEDVRSSMKSCNLKSKTKEAEVKPKEMKSQGDTNSVFLDNSRGIFSTPEFSASSAMDSPSHGSFTDKKKIVKKEEGSAMTTPVRRSSRIRNRAMSP